MVIVGVVSTSLHEFGHCVFYWIQGIPAGMSLVMEFPLINISAKQYGIGSAGGPIVNILLIIGAYYFVQKYDKKSKKWNVCSAIIVANSFYFIFRAILGLAKNDGGEIESSMNLIGLDFRTAAVLFFILALTILVLWVHKFKIKFSLGNSSYYLLVFISYLAIIMVMEGIDAKYFWDKYPSIEIDDGRIHNPHD